MMSQAHPLIKNPHLDGNSFILLGGRVGTLLIHGFKATPAEMRPLAEFLHAKGYTVKFIEKALGQPHGQTTPNILQS